jgi:2'-5' RNA ligase
LSERLRLFVALSLPELALDALRAWQRVVLARRSELRAVDGASLHATLCFLGSRPADDVQRIAAICLTLAGSGAARLRVTGSLWLPARRPSVLAVALEDLDGTLARAQSALSAALVAEGLYRPESRPYLAHVTVARVRSRGSVRGGGPARGAEPSRSRGFELPPPPALTFEADTVTLYRSRLERAGASYEALVRVSMGAS